MFVIFEITLAHLIKLMYNKGIYKLEGKEILQG